MKKNIFEYFMLTQNYYDLSYVVLGYYNLYCQIMIGNNQFYSKVVFCAVMCMVLSKTFDFMKIALQFSYVVTMIERVVKDLKSFLFFYTILIFQLSMILDVILMSNPDPNYKSVGPFIGNVLATMRISLGDFDFTELKNEHLTKHEHWLFWSMWILMVQFSLLIFLNFIIAEVSNSYAIVSENIEEII